MSDTPEIIRPALEMRGVSVSAIRDQNTVLLNDVNWTVMPGDFWVIGGLQGSGKTDFLLLAGGLMAPLAGSYQFLGETMPIFEEERLRERLKLGLVFDGGQLFNHLTVSENIALPLRYHRNLSAAQAKSEVQKLLEQTDLAPWADSTPGAIGRNWQKRVGLARALVLRPEVLLLDNPLTGLDLRHRAWWLNFLGELSRGHDWMEGRAVTVIATADDLRPWWKRAKQFALLKDKQFVTLGSWEQVENTNLEQVQELMTR
ncbi:MAG TPA: ATP-binding cassette domain-containing protein [Verrucomicrobiae bacterium]|nr:ATP-binding cassette domain-containing protein [Verrucomicrobiae bacterium]